MPAPTVNQVHIDAALSDLSVAYLQEKPPISDLIFPRVPVDFQSDKYFVWSRADFYRDDATQHAPGAKYMRTALNLTTDNYRCDEYGLEYPVPDQIVKNADQAVQLKQTGTRVLYTRLTTRKDRAFVNDFYKTGVWATDITGVAAAPGASQTLQWNDATSDPATDLQTAMETIGAALGEVDGMRWRLVIGAAVRASLLNHPDAIDRIKYVEKADVEAVDGILGSWLGVDDLIVGRRTYTTSAEGATAAYARIYGKNALLVAVPESPGIATPSAGYTFEWNEPGKGPIYTEEYRDETIKSDIIRSVMYLDQKQVASDLGYFFSSIVA